MKVSTLKLFSIPMPGTISQGLFHTDFVSLKAGFH